MTVQTSSSHDLQDTASTSVQAETAASGGFSPQEIQIMAKVLKKKHGDGAIAVAWHFKKEHEAVEDDVRADAWGRVAACLLEDAPIAS